MNKLIKIVNKYLEKHDLMPSVIFLGGKEKKCSIVFNGKINLDNMGFIVNKYTALHTWYYKWNDETNRTTIVFQI